MSNIKLISLMLIFIVCTQGCGSVANIGTFEDVAGLPIQDFAEIVKLESATISKDDISLYIENKTDDCIVFPNDYGTQIFYKLADGSWAFVPNLVDFPNTDLIHLSDRKGIEADAVLFIRPDTKRIPIHPATLRILITGYLCNNGIPVEELTGDFVDVEIP
jgi:hypothetical protein